MSTFTGGALKLKGGAQPPGVKKKKKKKNLTKSELAAVQDEPGTSNADDVTVMASNAGGTMPPPVEDRRTEAEKKAEAHAARHEEARIRKMAAKSHRERIVELNEKLSTLTEHHDLFRISYTA